jgi:hypothetical protein
VGHQHGGSHQAQRQRGAGQQPDEGAQPGKAAMPGQHRHLAAAGEVQCQLALAQHRGQLQLQLLLVALAVIDAPARRSVQQAGIDVEHLAIAPGDAFQRAARQTLQRRQRAGQQLDHRSPSARQVALT